MAKVDINELEKQAAKTEADTNSIKTRQVGDKTYFKGPMLEEWYDTYGECQQENQKALQLKTYKEQGLDESGRTASQVALSKKKGELLKVKEGYLDKAREIDVQISSLKEVDFAKKKASK